MEVVVDMMDSHVLQMDDEVHHKIQEVEEVVVAHVTELVLVDDHHNHWVEEDKEDELEDMVIEVEQGELRVV